MPYGVKRGVKAPGDYGAVDLMGLGLAGSAGIVAALITDYRQQGEASALYTINQWVSALGRMTGYGDVPLWMVVVLLIAVGAGSIFYFQPITRQGAFAQGFGLLAVLMTAVPSDLADALQSDFHDDLLPGLEADNGGREAALGAPSGIIRASYTPASGQARLYKAQGSSTGRYDVHIEIHFPQGLSEEMNTMIRNGNLRGRLHNPDTGRTYNLLRSSVRQRGNTIEINAGVPANSDTTTLWVRVEAAGYTIEEQSAQATAGSTLNWRIDMQPSSTPLFMQRLRKSYWF